MRVCVEPVAATCHRHRRRHRLHRHRRCHRRRFGSGAYLATLASKSDIYTTPNAQHERSMFIMRACLGEAHETYETMHEAKRPPERQDGRGPVE